MVRRFVGRVEEAALGVKVLKGVRPDQQLVKVVNDQLIELMGGQQEGLVEVKAGQTQVRDCTHRVPSPELVHNTPLSGEPTVPLAIVPGASGLLGRMLCGLLQHSGCVFSRSS